MDEQELLGELLKFAKDKPEVRKYGYYYPDKDAIRKYKSGKGKFPSKKALDFILRYLDYENLSRNSILYENSVKSFEDLTKNIGLHVTKYAAVELHRRDEEWEQQIKRFSEKYAGWYSLYRVDSRKRELKEFVLLRPHTGQNLRMKKLYGNLFIEAIWLHNQFLYVGDLVLSPQSFSGVLVPASTDRIIKVTRIN